MSSELCLIRRLPTRSLALVQIHGRDVAAGTRFVECQNAFVTAQNHVYSVGPGEWLFSGVAIEELRSRWSHDAPGLLGCVTDMSAAYSSLQVQGAAARDVLATDVGAAAMVIGLQTGTSTRTLLGQIDVILHCTAQDCFELHIDRSLVDYVEAWLIAISAWWR